MRREAEVYIRMVYMINEMLYLVLFVYEWCLKTDTKRLGKILKASLLSHT